jgi:hypothetical protein
MMRYPTAIFASRPSWKDILDQIDPADIPDDFLSPEERNQELPQERPELFEDWIEDPPPDPSVK